ncbi:MAG: FkbM family methyltransferase [Planctomycetaceae bacterium]
MNQGQCVRDIGGNLGVFSFLAAHRVGEGGHVVAVEADPFLASLIQRSVLLSNIRDRRIDVLCAAIANRSGVSQFPVAEPGRSSSSLEKPEHRSQAGDTKCSWCILKIALNPILGSFPKPDLPKVGVEGVELMALKGGSRLLKEARSRICIEVGDGQKTGVTALVKTAGYALCSGSVRLNSWVPVSECVFNTLPVPSEQDCQTLHAA